MHMRPPLAFTDGTNTYSIPASLRILSCSAVSFLIFVSCNATRKLSLFLDFLCSISVQISERRRGDAKPLQFNEKMLTIIRTFN